MDLNTTEYTQFKDDCESMKVVDFMDKWKKHPKYNIYEMKIFDEDFNGYVCEEYNYDKKQRNGKYLRILVNYMINYILIIIIFIFKIISLL